MCRYYVKSQQKMKEKINKMLKKIDKIKGGGGNEKLMKETRQCNHKSEKKKK